VEAAIIASVVGLVVGISLWFPYKSILDKLVKKKREASSLLKELGMSEHEHMQWMNPQYDFSRTNIGPGTVTSGTTSNWTAPNTWANTTANLNETVGSYYAKIQAEGQQRSGSTRSGTS